MAMLSIDESAAFVHRAQQQGRRVVFTTGVFDLLHPGHVRFLQAARGRGDVLIVALSSDRSVRATLGPARPIVPERERAETLAALAAVDAVLIADDDMRQAVIARLKPDVVVASGGWSPGWSTSAIMAKARSVPGR